MAVKKPEWIKMSQEELEKIILELAQKNIHPSKIGLILRDRHGVPTTRVFGKKLGQIIKEKQISVNQDENLKKRVESLEKHLSLNKQDRRAQKSLIEASWQLKSLSQ